MEKKIDFDAIVFEKKNQTAEKTIAAYLTQNQQTLALAESCTGGYLSHLITALPGSSTYYKGGIVAYSNEIKTRILQIPEQILMQEGAVSETTVILMANNVKSLFKSDYAIAISGIAGPGGGSIEKPVGTVWVAIDGQNKTISHLFQFGNIEREMIIRKTAIYSLALLYDVIHSKKH